MDHFVDNPFSSQVLGGQSTLASNWIQPDTRIGYLLREVQIYVTDIEYRTCLFSTQDGRASLWTSSDLKYGYQQVRNDYNFINFCAFQGVSITRYFSIIINHTGSGGNLFSDESSRSWNCQWSDEEWWLVTFCLWQCFEYLPDIKLLFLGLIFLIRPLLLSVDGVSIISKIWALNKTWRDSFWVFRWPCSFTWYLPRQTNKVPYLGPKCLVGPKKFPIQGGQWVSIIDHWNRILNSLAKMSNWACMFWSRNV